MFRTVLFSFNWKVTHCKDMIMFRTSLLAQRLHFINYVGTAGVIDDAYSTWPFLGTDAQFINKHWSLEYVRD